MTVDRDFLRQVEGFNLTATVPDAEGSRSGVTVGNGIDLAHNDVNRLDIPEGLKEKLRPYRGLTGNRAKEFLRHNPLRLTEEEAQALSNDVTSRMEMFVRNRWNADSDVKWNSLPDALKTVVYSVVHQYGSPDRVPNFWQKATSLDTSGVINELRDFGDRYDGRREQEAEYLENYLTASRSGRVEGYGNALPLPRKQEAI